MAWFGRGNRHSTIVAWAKVLLPLMALAALSTLFLFSHAQVAETTIPYADSASSDLSTSQKMTDATYASMTQDGAALKLNAVEATPSISSTDLSGAAKGLTGVIETPDGISTKVTGATGVLDQLHNILKLQGGVTVTNSAGFDAQTEDLTVTLDRTRLESAGEVIAHSSFGQIQAGKLVMTRAAAGDYMLDFTGGVRLIYQPEAAGTTNP